jgi:hypothetical protein
VHGSVAGFPATNMSVYQMAARATSEITIKFMSFKDL